MGAAADAADPLHPPAWCLQADGTLTELLADEAVLQRLLRPLGGTCSSSTSAGAAAANGHSSAAANGAPQPNGAAASAAPANSSGAGSVADAAASSSGRDPDEQVRAAVAEAVAALVSGADARPLSTPCSAAAICLCCRPHLRPLAAAATATPPAGCNRRWSQGAVEGVGAGAAQVGVSLEGRKAVAACNGAAAGAAAACRHTALSTLHSPLSSALAATHCRCLCCAPLACPTPCRYEDEEAPEVCAAMEAAARCFMFDSDASALTAEEDGGDAPAQQ